MTLPVLGYAGVVLTCFLVCFALLVSRPAVPAPETTLTKIAFGSCLKQDEPAPILQTINQYGPQVFIFLGDNVYVDTDDRSEMQAAYDALAKLPGAQQLAQQSRVLAIWDDHDFGKNDGGADWPHKQMAKDIMLDFFNEPKGSARRAREGNYDAGVLGPPGRRVQVILLDTRWFRSELKRDEEAEETTFVPNDDPEATLLGEAQWAWLEEQLTEPADIRIICSSIQLLSDRHRFEKWANFPSERERFLKLVENAGDVLVLSGDRHSAELSLMQYGGADGKVLLEATSSALNQSRVRSEATLSEVNPYRARTNQVYTEPNFGTIDIDWNFRLVVVSLRDLQGNVVAELPLKMADPQ